MRNHERNYRNERWDNEGHATKNANRVRRSTDTNEPEHEESVDDDRR